MRSIDARGTIYEARRDAHRALVSLLLAGAVLTPALEYVAGWSLGRHHALRPVTRPLPMLRRRP